MNLSNPVNSIKNQRRDEHIPIRAEDLAEVLRVIGHPPSFVEAPLREVLARILRQVDDAAFDEADRSLVRAFLSCTSDAAPEARSSGIELTPTLRPRHRETLQWLLTGATEKEIACALNLSVHTVHQYVKAIYRRFRVTSRAQLMASRLRPNA